MATVDHPNILFIMSDDIGWFNVSCYNHGVMGYRTPNIDRIAAEGAMFTDFYGQQSCTAGRAAFITGQQPIRTGLTKVGFPGAMQGLSAEDPTIAQFLKNFGYATGQFGTRVSGGERRRRPTPCSRAARPGTQGRPAAPASSAARTKQVTNRRPRSVMSPCPACRRSIAERCGSGWGPRSVGTHPSSLARGGPRAWLSTQTRRPSPRGTQRPPYKA